MSPQSHIAAVILAAGESSRLGKPKQLIQFRGKTLVRRVVDGASEAGCRAILVVLGTDRTSDFYRDGLPRVNGRQHETELITSELKKRRATRDVLSHPQSAMATPIRA